MNYVIVVDTDILIDADRGIEQARLFLNKISSENILAISEITVMEIIVGCKNKNELFTAEKYLSQFMIYKINEQISDKALSLLKIYNLSHGLLIADSFIAATAIITGSHFSTKNQKHFRFIKDLELIDY